MCEELSNPFWVQAKKASRVSGFDGWETLAEFATLDDAQMALADSRRFPLDRSYRVIQVIIVL